MKGILVVNKIDLIDKHELLETLRGQCERIDKTSDHIRLRSKDGSLMPMICALLDQEVHYNLELESTTAPGSF